MKNDKMTIAPNITLPRNIYHIKQLPSGFYAVFCNNTYLNAALPSIDAAREMLRELQKSSNYRRHHIG